LELRLERLGASVLWEVLARQLPPLLHWGLDQLLLPPPQQTLKTHLEQLRQHPEGLEVVHPLLEDLEVPRHREGLEVVHPLLEDLEVPRHREGLEVVHPLLEGLEVLRQQEGLELRQHREHLVLVGSVR
jgi:hypothetical protein